MSAAVAKEHEFEMIPLEKDSPNIQYVANKNTGQIVSLRKYEKLMR